MLKIIHTKDEEEWLRARLLDVTSTEVAALFGLSPYLTQFELWHRKKSGELVAFQENVRMKWGKRLEESIARGIAEDHGLTIRPMKEYIRDDELKAGASFDFAIRQEKIVAATPTPLSMSSGAINTAGGKMVISEDVGILEIKNVDGLIFNQQWESDGEHIEAPPHIELQVQQQLMLSEYGFAKIGALVGGNEVALLDREPDLTVHSRIKEEISDFWDSIANNKPPEMDFQRDANFITQLYRHAEPGKIIEATDEITSLAIQYKTVTDQEKLVDAEKKAIKAQLLTLIGDAEKCRGQKFSISAGVRGPVVIETYERAGFRDFRVNFKKLKGETDGND